MRKVKALSWLAGGNPRGCNVGIYNKNDEAVARATALFGFTLLLAVVFGIIGIFIQLAAVILLFTQRNVYKEKEQITDKYLNEQKSHYEDRIAYLSNGDNIDISYRKLNQFKNYILTGNMTTFTRKIGTLIEIRLQSGVTSCIILIDVELEKKT